MLVLPLDHSGPVVLVPHSGIQFLEYGLDIDKINRFQRRFIERAFPAEADGAEIPVRLVQGWNDGDPNMDADEPRQPDDIEYSINKERALEPFLNKWTPVPFLRIRPGLAEGGTEAFDKGPSNWARIRVVANEGRFSGEGPTHIAIFAFDTELSAETLFEKDGAPYPYAMPLLTDAEYPSREFRFVFSTSHLGWFLTDPQEAADGISGTSDYQAWVVDWIHQLFIEFKRSQRPGRDLRPEDFPNKLEHAARWFAFLELLKIAIDPPKIRFADTVSADPHLRPVDVDLVVDVGNSRTCGILVETHGNQDFADLGAVHVLEMRDVSRPEHVYAEPFDSRVELAQASFGFEHISRNSGRTRAFQWPSLVRVGTEATRIRSSQSGTEVVSGMSSPKRYLWDVNAVNQEWRFPEKDYTKDGFGPPIERIVKRFVNSTGDVISSIRTSGHSIRKLMESLYPGRRPDDLTRAMGARLTFSRSSFYTLALVEVLWQAWCMINSERFRSAQREKDVPRRLRRIILTLPTAMPVREQRLMAARARGAIDLIWDITGWSQRTPPGIVKPEIQVAWDEATCVQFVWLYAQIARRYQGKIRDFLELFGKPRGRFSVDDEAKPTGEPEPSLRIASIDIGGGTTDLMIITYFQDHDRQIVPIQTFREGFRVAGDDIVKSVIENIILPALRDHLLICGLRDPKRILLHCFGADRAGLSVQEKQLRRQFVLGVLEPAALGLLHRYEEAGSFAYHSAETVPLRALLKTPQLAVLEGLSQYIEDPVRMEGGSGFSLLDTPIVVDFTRMRQVVIAEMDKVFSNMCEAINHLGCDVVVVAGRPSRLPAISETLIDRLPISPDRFVSLHDFATDGWYPFRNQGNRSIADPKTAVVVGATLCLLAERQIPNFRLATDLIQMRSTARFIGEMEGDRKILDQRVLFKAQDLHDNPGGLTMREMLWYAPAQIGFRQLPFERWLATPLYKLNYEGDGLPPLPIKVTLDRELPDSDPEDKIETRLDQEATKEELKISYAEDRDGRPLTEKMSLSFRTMPLNSPDYWLETGSLQIL